MEEPRPVRKDEKISQSTLNPKHRVLKNGGLTSTRFKSRVVTGPLEPNHYNGETSPPTPSMETLRILSGYAAKYGSHIQIGDVESA